MTTAEPEDWELPSGHNLPTEVASFIGRERELAEIKRLSARTRLVTITGVGGSGKTRLALRAAADLAPGFADGVRFAQLAPLSDSSLIPRAIASALGERLSADQRPLLATLVDALATQRLLLILDNCEHLIGGCARVAETLLRGCPHLRIIATSREPLRIPGEVIWRAPALETPEDSTPLDTLAQVESVALFLDRAQARDPNFALTANNAPAVAAICRQLDGLPLGIELAAAHVGALTPEQISARLGDALRLLGGGSRTLPRQETLRATLDWSHALLAAPEISLFRRLAVFGGGFDLDAVEGVCCGAGLDVASALPMLEALAEKSLIEPQIRLQGARYRLLEPVRQYAWERLGVAGEADDLRRRHARYFLQLAEAHEPQLMSGDRGAAMERLGAEQDNLRIALGWSAMATDPEDIAVGLRLMGALFWFWGIRGEASEGLEWVAAALARGQRGAPAAVWTKLMYVSGEMYWIQGRHSRARARLEESAAAWRTMGEKRALAYSLQSLAMVAEPSQAQATAEESLSLFREVGDTWGAAHAQLSLAMLAFLRDDPLTRERMEEALAAWKAIGDSWGVAQMLNYLGDYARSHDDRVGAAAAYQQALELLRRQDVPGTIPSLLHNLGYLALRAGDARQALRLFREGLGLFRRSGDLRGIAECLTGVGGALGALKQPERAARLFGAAQAISERIGATVWPANVADVAWSERQIRYELAAPTYAAAFAEGQAFTLEQALAEAQQSSSLAASIDATPLTPREREIAALIAEGLTNRQIGETLIITEGTARLHVKHVLHKLGFATRAQVAGWAVAQGLVAPPRSR
jgi:predicted ATPase/DNA-binding CsgD family transcriptional regulator